MLPSRAARLPRVCLSCRLSLSARPLLPRRQVNHVLRTYSSSSRGIASKELIEALISGKESLEASHRKRVKFPRRRDDDDDNTWEPKQPEKPAHAPPIAQEATLDAIIQQKPEEPSILASIIPEDPLPAAPPAETEASPAPAPARPAEYFRDRLFDLHRVNAEALGRPVDTLVIKDPDMLRRKGAGSSISMPTADNTGELDWRSLLDPEQGADIDAVAEALANIESFRPMDRTIPRRELHKLLDTLCESFTKDQLALYYSQAEDPTKPAPQAPQTPEYTWIIGETKWKSDNPESIGAESPKKRVARMIATARWGIQAQEEVEGLGLKEIRVSPQVYKMVSRPSIGASEVLTSRMLSTSLGETITPGNNGNITLHTRKSIVPGILSAIDELSQSLVTKVVPLGALSSQPDFSPELWEGLSRRTGTWIEHIKTDEQKIRITWLAPRTLEATSLEDTPETVMRLLRGRPSQHLATEEHLLGRRMRNRSTILSAGRLVPHHRDTRGMTWRDKLHRWSRFVLPASVPDGSKPKHLKLASRVDLSCPPDSSSGQAAQDTLTATFGHILHHKPIPKADKTTTKRSAAARRRILSPVVPHPAAFTDLPATDLTKQLSIVLNFVPAATGTPAASAPEVKLTLPIVEDADYERASISPASTLHATRPVLAKDILVPDEAVDVRVVRQAETPLDLDGQDGLRAFLDASQLVLSQGLLKTPSATTLVLPGGDAPVPYLFAGLTVHDTVDLAWEDGCTLRFESVEADRHEGTYQQLSVRSGASSTEEAFLALLERAVEGKIWSWTKGVDQVREIPEEEEELYEEEEDVYDDQAEEVEAMAEQESSLDAVCHDALAAGYKLSDSIEDHLEQMLLTELEADEDFSRALEDVSVEVDAPHASLDAACHESLAAGHRLAGRIEDQLDQMLQRELEAVNEQMEDPEHDKQPSEKTTQ